MSNQPLVSEFIENLIQKTRDGKIRWESTAIEDRFIASVGGRYSILIEKTKSLYRLSLEDLDKRGEPQEIVAGFNEQFKYHKELKELFDLIGRNRTIEFEQTVGGVLEALNQL